MQLENMVGPALRRFRNERGLTQEQLAAQCQVRGIYLTRGTLAKIEAQVRYIKACELFVIGKILKVPLEHFFNPEFTLAVANAATEVDGRAADSPKPGPVRSSARVKPFTPAGPARPAGPAG